MRKTGRSQRVDREIGIALLQLLSSPLLIRPTDYVNQNRQRRDSG